MRAGTGADRIVADTASALASGVVFTPALFIDGERYRSELEPEACPPRWGGTPTARPNVVARCQGRKARPVFDSTQRDRAAQ